MELDRSSVIDRLQSRIMSIDDFNFDRLSAPPLYSLLSQQDIDTLYKVAHSIKYSGNPAKKYKMIDNVLKPRGFSKLSAGTNRIIYKHTEFDNIVLKVAYDDIGLKDNPKEFMNQHIFKPFVTKVFEVSPCGTVAVVERVIPITSREEFHSVAEDVYLAINNWFIGKYIMADIGTKFFMNWGIRRGFGVVLLDFPYCYELDGNKLYCSALNINSHKSEPCGGLIDYDDGFNFLVCEKCGTRYRVNELGKSVNNKNIIVKGRRKNKMKVSTVRHGVKVSVAEDNLGFKPETASVVVEEKTSTAPVGSLKVSTKYVEVEKKKKGKGKVSVNMNSAKQKNRENNNNRGSVRSDKVSGSSIRVSAPSAAPEAPKAVLETPVAEEIIQKAEVTVVGFDEDNKVINLKLICGDITTETSIEVDSIPESYIAAIIESSDINTELSQALLDLNSAESENIEYKKRLKKLSEDLEKQLDMVSELKAAKDELEKKVVYLEDKMDDTLVDKLKQEITKLQSKIKAEREEAETKAFSDVSLLEEKNAEIERLITENQSLSNSISELSEQIANTSQESYHYDKEISKLKEEIVRLTGIVEDKDAKIEAMEGLLAEANEKVESIQRKFRCNNFEWGRENDVYEMFEKVEIGASFIQGKIVPITSLVSDTSVIPENISNEYVIIFPTGDEDSPNFVDQDNNIIAVTSINGSLIGEIMDPPGAIEMVEAPVGSTQQ